MKKWIILILLLVAIPCFGEEMTREQATERFADDQRHANLINGLTAFVEYMAGVEPRPINLEACSGGWCCKHNPVAGQTECYEE